MSVHEDAASGIFDEPLGRLVQSELGVRLAVFDPHPEVHQVDDKLTRYREIARRVVAEYAGHKSSHGEIDSYPVIDPVGGHHLAMSTGLDRHYRIQGAFAHLDIIGGRFWVRFDGTDRPVVDELEAARLPKENIALGEKSPRIRPHTGYAIG